MSREEYDWFWYRVPDCKVLWIQRKGECELKEWEKSFLEQLREQSWVDREKGKNNGDNESYWKRKTQDWRRSWIFVWFG